MALKSKKEWTSRTATPMIIQGRLRPSKNAMNNMSKTTLTFPKIHFNTLKLQNFGFLVSTFVLLILLLRRDDGSVC